MKQTRKQESVEVASAFPAGWYDYADAEHFWFRWRLRAFVSVARSLDIPLSSHLHILDIGAGTGIWANQLEAHSQWTVDRCENNPQALANHIPGRGEAFSYDLLKPAVERLGRYDGIVLFDVIEHIGNTYEFLTAALKHLKPRGWIFINVPAGNYLYSDYDRVVGHLRRYNKKTTADELLQSGAEVRAVRYWGMSLIPAALARRWFLHQGARDASEVVRRGFAPPSRWVNFLFTLLMSLETKVLRRPVLGTSVLCVGRKR